MTQKFSANLGLPAVPEEGMTPELFKEVLKLQNAIKIVMAALDQYTGVIGQDQEIWDAITPITTLGGLYRRVYVRAGEDLPAGNFVNLYNDAGTLKARLASSAAGFKARGFVNTAALNGEMAEVILQGIHVLFSGLTPGTMYYIAGTPGQITTAATAQMIGFALSDQILYVSPTLAV